MSGILVEGGIYFLLLFTPLAFGGVETWAIGVFQIVAAIVFVAWALGDGSPWSRWRREGGASLSGGLRKPVRVLWACILLFLLLGFLQIVPLPGGLIRTLAPATWSLYARAVPGYAEGATFRSEDLPAWLLTTQQSQIQAVGSGATRASGPPDLPIAQAEWSIAASPRRTLSVYPYFTRQRLTLLSCFVGIFAAVTGHFRTRERIRRLLGFAVGSVALVSMFGILQKLSWNGKLYWIREGFYASPFGPFVHRNNYAGFAVTVLPLSICLSFAALAKLRRGHRDATPPLLLYCFASIVMCAGIFYSLSRAGMLTAAFCVVVVGAFLFYFGRHALELRLLTGLFVLSGILLVWIGSSGEVVERMQTMSEGYKTPTLEMRRTAWGNAVSLIGENGLLGTGLGTFRYAFMRYAPPGRTWWQTADNEFIEVFTDTGLVGGLLALTGLGAFFTAIMRPWRFRGRSGRYAFVGLAVGIAALLIHSTVHSNLQIPAITLLVIVLGGALLNHVRIYGKPEAGRGSP